MANLWENYPESCCAAPGRRRVEIDIVIERGNLQPFGGNLIRNFCRIRANSPTYLVERTALLISHHLPRLPGFSLMLSSA